jgi:hypothetical protein
MVFPFCIKIEKQEKKLYQGEYTTKVESISRQILHFPDSYLYGGSGSENNIGSGFGFGFVS